MSFVADLSKFKTTSIAELNRLRDAVVLAVFRGTILSTPVLTGRLRANWQFSRTSPITDALDDTDPTGAKAIGRVSAALRGNPVGDDRVFLTNNLPYAYRIEYEGWSRIKAPNGMVRINVRRVIENLRKKQLDQS